MSFVHIGIYSGVVDHWMFMVYSVKARSRVVWLAFMPKDRCGSNSGYITGFALLTC